ncbi:MAG TPA: potassium transporter Kup [Planctomycetaceae bacterium]|nr:potassium transporter Kup [Planctomycetaceae bacterium]
MQATIHSDDVDSSARPHGRQFALLSIGVLGVVYGDIGTSPLYSVRECFHGQHAIDCVPLNILGVLSLIFWALILVISVKYLIFILRADNRGEGGILALASLVTPVRAAVTRRGIVPALGLFGAALLYADGMITPAISVLGAVEGLTVAIPALHQSLIEGIAVAVLLGLFVLQSRGTSGVGKVFGPVILIWFLAIAAIGIGRIADEPAVFRAVNPFYAAEFFRHNGWHGFVILGAVFLVVTGGEALYADIGHFGARPIRAAWFAVVLPALLLNYFGQGALLLTNPARADQPFYHTAPEWALLPLVVLATAAAVIASQAIITGSFSLTLQAIQLGYCPRLTIEHTSSQQKGQIFVPAVNWLLMIACIGLVLGFHSSSNLAAAYGVAITVTMVITTVLFFVLVKDRWKWSLPLAIGVSGLFLTFDLSFFGANALKLAHGGWFPIVVASGVYLLMATWRKGRRLVTERLRRRLIPLDLYLAELLSDPPVRVPGVAVFMASNPVGTPMALRHNVIHNKVLHQTVVVVTVETADVPHVLPDGRAAVEEVGEGFWRVFLKYGFMDQPNIPLALSQVRQPGLELTPNVSYFLGRETVLATGKPGMVEWRERLFVWMSRNAQSATHFFQLPPEQVIEVGVQMEL